MLKSTPQGQTSTRLRLASEYEEQRKIGVELVGQPSGGGPWRTTFRVTNEGDEPLVLLSASMPHIVYRAEAADFTGSEPLDSHAAVDLEFDATYTPREDPYEPSNPFLIVRFRWRGEEWRVLTQLSIAGAPDVAPDLGIAKVGTHRVGFSSDLM